MKDKMQCNFDTMTIERLRMVLEQQVSFKTNRILNLRPIELFKREGDILVMRVEAGIAALPEKTVSIHKRWPSNWLQSLKERWAPRWWRNRWPVQYERIDVEQKIYKAVCPHIRFDDDCYKFLVERECCGILEEQSG